MALTVRQPAPRSHYISPLIDLSQNQSLHSLQLDSSCARRGGASHMFILTHATHATHSLNEQATFDNVVNVSRKLDFL